MEVHLIYDNRPQPDKMILLSEEIQKQRIVLAKIWEPILSNSVVESINATHKAIVRYAKEKRLPEICIMEDDNYFPAIDGWEYFIKNKPDRFDAYMAGTYLINRPEDYSPPVIKVDGWVGNHLIIISQKYYETFLSVPDNEHIDVAQNGRGDFYVCFPFAALQRPGFSANCRVEVNYNSSLKKEWIYG